MWLPTFLVGEGRGETEFEIIFLTGEAVWSTLLTGEAVWNTLLTGEAVWRTFLIGDAVWWTFLTGGEDWTVCLTGEAVRKTIMIYLFIFKIEKKLYIMQHT